MVDDAIPSVAFSIGRLFADAGGWNRQRMPNNSARNVMSQDEPIKPDDEAVDERVNDVDAGAQADSETKEPAVEETPQPDEAKPVVTKNDGGAKWLVRTGVQAAVVVVVAGFGFFLLGVAQRTKWLTADGFPAAKAIAEPFTSFIVPTLYCGYLELKMRFGFRDELWEGTEAMPEEELMRAA